MELWFLDEGEVVFEEGEEEEGEVVDEVLVALGSAIVGFGYVFLEEQEEERRKEGKKEEDEE